MAGNHNSGNRCQSGKALTTSKLILDINLLKRDNQLELHHQYNWNWYQNNQLVGAITIQNNVDSIQLDYQTTKLDQTKTHSYQIKLAHMPCHFGGVRVWFQCPCCHNRVGKLFSGEIFACRKCLRLTYPVCNENSLDRQTRKINKLRKNLGWEAGFLNGNGGKPKHMHWQTYYKLLDEYQQQENQICKMMNSYFIKTFNRPIDDFIN